MRTILLILLLASCAGTPPGVRPVTSGLSRADGIVAMTSRGTIFNPVSADWRPAQTEADRRCKGWGYSGAGSFSGWQESCRAYDLYGRCTGTAITRFYPCTGEG